MAGERRLFALDQNFPLPIVTALQPYVREADLVALKEIDARLSELDDWEVLLALHLHSRPWAGLITTDIGMTKLPRELAVLMQTKLSLVVADGTGHDPIRATGLLLAHLPRVCARRSPSSAQVWILRAQEKRPDDPWDHLTNVASHQSTTAARLYEQHQLTPADLVKDPLA